VDAHVVQKHGNRQQLAKKPAHVGSSIMPVSEFKAKGLELAVAQKFEDESLTNLINPTTLFSFKVQTSRSLQDDHRGETNLIVIERATPAKT